MDNFAIILPIKIQMSNCNILRFDSSNIMKNILKEKYWLLRVKQYQDAEAYGKIYDAYVEQIFRFISFKVATVEDAEDITAEVFLKAWQYIKTSDKKIENLNALLYRTARNAVIDYYRDKRRTEMPMSDQEQFENIMDSRNIMVEMDSQIGINEIQKYLDQLKDEYREVLVLRHIEEFSINEIASIIGKSRSNVRVILHRATKCLRDLMEK